MINGQLVKLDPANRAHVGAATSLTLSLFADSPAGILGKVFLREFYFTSLPKLGLIDCFLYEVDGEYVGFIVYTAHPYSFIDTGLKKRFPQLLFATLYSLCVKPRRLLAVWNVQKQDRWRRGAEKDPDLCEMLTFGVIPSFRRKVDAATGIKISRRIFEAALQDMYERGRKRCLLVVLRDNLLAKRYYTKYRTRPLPMDYCNPVQELLVFDLDPRLWTDQVARVQGL